jgi:hypothetical protein
MECRWRGIFHPQISPIDADSASEKICEICVICGFVFQAINGSSLFVRRLPRGMSERISLVQADGIPPAHAKI